MREVPLDPLAPLPLQPLATFALNAAPIAVHRFLLRLFAIPVAGSTIWLGNVSSHFHLGQSHHHIVAVIALCPPPLLVRLPDALHTCLQASSLRSSQPPRCRLQSL